MMATTFSGIVGAVIELLGQAPAVSPNIYRARDRAIPKQNETAVTVLWDGAMPTPGAIVNAPVDWQTRVVVECYARSTDTGGDEAVDPLLLAVYDRMASDTTLGNRVFDIGSPALEAEYGADGEKTGWVRMTYVVRHRTKNSTLEVTL
ncbi:hypothetical protein ACEN9F_13395 [Duganella sp. CT11-25]|uniref:hypothetical protein n=1 Tax=unclassified Duganella TaxID=2636909 RepID=UPI0039AF541C